MILDSGRIFAEGTPLALKNTYTGDFITLYGTEKILKYPEVFQDYEITKGKMDDVFLAVTGKKLTGGAGK